jgi:flagellar basal-body rod protein FlgG
MMRSLYTAATGMNANERKMDVIANNLANAGTTGFKKTRLEFEDLLSETIRISGTPDGRGGNEPSPLQVGLGVRTAATTRSLQQGELISTNNQTDLAVQGTGYFRVQRANGEYAYTRAGNFAIDANHRLVTQHGELIDPTIDVPAAATSISISQDGVVSATVSGRDQPQEIGQINLASFVNPAGLLALGDNLFAATGGSGSPTMVKPGEQSTGTLAQGFLENSNVKAVEEMVEMIAAQRAYELNSKVIQTADQMLQRLTSLR